ncbi:MAG: STAS domain-containing protein [Fibrobacterota bacterium]
MEIQNKYHCGYAIFEVRGEITNPRMIDKIEKAVKKEVESGEYDIGLDLHNAEYINSGLIRYFIGWNKLCTENNKKFCLIEPSSNALEVLEITGVTKLVEIYRTEAEFSRKVRPSSA